MSLRDRSHGEAISIMIKIASSKTSRNDKLIMKIAIVYSIPTRRAMSTTYLDTDKDTEFSAREIGTALESKGAEVILVPVTEDSLESIDQISADLIFNLIEWTGLDVGLTIAAFKRLEAQSVPFTGCSLPSLIQVADKIKMKKDLDLAGLPTPSWQEFKTGDEQVSRNLKFPAITKLALEHCSIGLTRESVVNDPEALRKVVRKFIGEFKQTVFAEEFIAGREFQITIIEEKGIRVLPPAEIIFKNPGELTFLTYKSRWDETHADYQTSTVGLAELTPNFRNKLESLSLEAYRVFGCRDYGRIDIRTREDDIFILEVNPNPGLGEDEEYGMTVSYRAANLTFADFIWKIVESSLRRSD